MAAANPSLSDFDFTDAPGGELTFDQLFPNDAGPQPTTADTTGAPSETTAAPQAPAIEPVAQPVDEPFYLRAGDSVYKSKEEAERGIQTKDTLIQELRLKEIARTGIDPLTNKPVNAPPPQPQVGQTDYTQNQDKYFQDLVAAVDSNDPRAYYNAQAKLIQDVLAPLAPAMTELARNRAVQSASTEIKDLSTFLASESYQKTLEATPALRGAIQAAEADMRMYSQLPDLYQLAYWTDQGRRMPDLLKAAQQQPQSNQTPQARPLTQPANTVPPIPSARPDISTREGRKAIIDSMESQGIANLKW